MKIRTPDTYAVLKYDKREPDECWCVEFGGDREKLEELSDKLNSQETDDNIYYRVCGWHRVKKIKLEMEDNGGNK